MHLVEVDVVVAVPVDGHGGRAIRQGPSVRNSDGWLRVCPFCSLQFAVCSLQFTFCHARPSVLLYQALAESFTLFLLTICLPSSYQTSHAIDDTRIV